MYLQLTDSVGPPSVFIAVAPLVFIAVASLGDVVPS
jgi:hypothetical protein